VLGETFELHALPGTKNTLVDFLTAFSNGFGGDPNNHAKLNFYKGKLYEFSGLFRRHREYFDISSFDQRCAKYWGLIPLRPE
jgi:hypothetical protein